MKSSTNNQSQSIDRQFKAIINNIDRNHGKLQLLQGLFKTKDIIHVDPQKIYCIVQTEHYMTLKNEITKSKDSIETLSEKIYEKEILITTLSKEKEIYQREYERLSQNQTLLRDNILDISQKLKARNAQLSTLEERIVSFISKFNQESLGQTIKTSVTHTHPVETWEISVQTCLTPEILSEMAEQAVAQVLPPSTQRLSQLEANLYVLFQQKISFFERELNTKLQMLKSHEHNIEKWENENRTLSQENQSLKQQIIDRNIEEEKLTIWRQSVFSFINKIQHNTSQDSHHYIQEPSNQATRADVEDLKNQIVHLKGKMAQIREQGKWVQQFMLNEQQINDDGAVGLMVRLSQKLKTLVRNMLLQVELQ